MFNGIVLGSCMGSRNIVCILEKGLVDRMSLSSRWVKKALRDAILRLTVFGL